MNARSAPNDTTRWVHAKGITLVTNFIAGVGVLAFCGYQLDKYLATNYYIWTLCGILLGLSWGFYELIKFVRGMERVDAAAAEKTNSDEN